MKNKNKIMEVYMKIYEQLPHRIIDNVGGWVRKSDMLGAYPYSSNTTCNEHYNRVVDAWEQKKIGIVAYCRPRTDWDDIIISQNFENVSMINIGARLLQNMEILHRTWDNLVSDLLPYQNRLHEEYAGMYSDIEMKLSDFNTHVINTIQTMAEQKTGEDE
jgi:hypothetical protein